MTPKRLLVLSPRFLFPLDQGGRIRTANTLRHMKGGAFHITLLSPAPPDADRWAAETARLCDRFVSWPETTMSTPRKVVALAGAVPVAVATDNSAEGRAVVATELANGADAILVDFPHAAIMLPPQVDIPAIIFTHNVEAEIFARHADVTRGPMRRVWSDQARKMRRFEGEAIARCDKVIAVSERDARALEKLYGLTGVEPIETGVDTEFYAYNPPVAAPADGGTVVFTGSMDSRSNIDGIEFLMDEIWPKLLERRPKARAIIAGRNPPERLTEAATARGFDWTFTGFVDDVRPFVESGHVYAIPLRVGSGTRIKVFEAMAMGCPVVSTGLGVEGLDVTPEANYLAADTAEDFAAALARILDDPALQQRLSTDARTLVTTRFGWPVVTRRFEEICLSALR
ncbi:MAG: glycosyltransferase family 4 protein [Pseudomonadota bacterium]|nr:glycosyltransferase family 4 protein [Pseudomonadota bacterium]